MTQEMMDILKEADRTYDDMQKIGRWNNIQAEEYMDRVLSKLYDMADESTTKETLQVLMKMGYR